MYIEEEMTTTATDSPFRADGAIAGIMEALIRLRCEDQKDIRKLVESVEMLARVRPRPSPPPSSCCSVLCSACSATVLTSANVPCIGAAGRWPASVWCIRAGCFQAYYPCVL